MGGNKNCYGAGELTQLQTTNLLCVLLLSPFTFTYKHALCNCCPLSLSLSLMLAVVSCQLASTNYDETNQQSPAIKHWLLLYWVLTMRSLHDHV